MPIRFYQNSIITGNIVPSGNTTLGVALYPGQTTVITRTLTGLASGWASLYVRLLDDGVDCETLEQADKQLRLY
jgi:hypothetical protein